MKSRQRVTVYLPNPTPSVVLPSNLARVLDRVIGSKGISSLELSVVGCLNPVRAISYLKKRGAIILTDRRDVVDSEGVTHPRVAHYIYVGWVPSTSPLIHDNRTQTIFENQKENDSE